MIRHRHETAERRTSPRAPALAATLAVALSLGACSDGDDGGTPSDDGLSGPELASDDRPGLAVRFPAGRSPEALDSPWIAFVDLFQIAARPDTTGDVFAELIRYDDPLDLAAHIDFYDRDLDVCRIRDLGADDGSNDEENDGKRRVSGGDLLTLSSAGGTWLEVPFSNALAAYDGDDVFPAPVPDDLSLSLPGAEFPAVDALAFSVPAVPTRLAPTVNETVTPASEYRWVPGDGEPGTSVRLVFLAYTEGEFQGFPISCRVVDDGEFALPAEALAEVERRRGELQVRFIRETRRVEYRDGIVLFSSVSIADD